MESQGDIGILCSIRPRLLQLDLVERQLLRTFTRYVLKVNGFVAQIFERQAVHIMAGARRLKHIGFKHCIERNSAHGNAVVGQHAGIVFEILTQLLFAGVFEQGFQHGQHLLPIKLSRRTQIVMGQWHVCCDPRFDRE